MLKSKLRKVILYLLDLLRPLIPIIPLKIKEYIFRYLINPLTYSDAYTIASYGDLKSDKTILLIGGYNAGLYSIIHNIVVNVPAKTWLYKNF